MDLEPFNEVEKKYDLLNINIDGYYFWIYARAEIAWHFEQKNRTSRSITGTEKNKQRGACKNQLGEI